MVAVPLLRVDEPTRGASELGWAVDSYRSNTVYRLSFEHRLVVCLHSTVSTLSWRCLRRCCTLLHAGSIRRFRRGSSHEDCYAQLGEPLQSIRSSRACTGTYRSFSKRRRMLERFDHLRRRRVG